MIALNYLQFRWSWTQNKSKVLLRTFWNKCGTLWNRINEEGLWVPIWVLNEQTRSLLRLKRNLHVISVWIWAIILKYKLEVSFLPSSNRNLNQRFIRNSIRKFLKLPWNGQKWSNWNRNFINLCWTWKNRNWRKGKQIITITLKLTSFKIIEKKKA